MNPLRLALAAALAADDRDFARLSEDEKKKVIETIALQIHGRRRKQAKSMRSYKLVSAVRDKEPVETPPEKTMTTHEVQTPDYGRLFADNEWEVAEGSPDVADAVKKGFDDKTRKLLADTYDPFKFVSVSFVVANETAAEKPGVSAPGEAHSVLVAVDYKEKPEFHWPRTRIRLPRLPKSHRNWGSAACPRFH